MSQAVSRTQIWVRARMAGYSLNYTARSCAIHRGQRCQFCCSPTRKWPSPKQVVFRPRICHWFRYPIQYECQTARQNPGKYIYIYIYNSPMNSLYVTSLKTPEPVCSHITKWPQAIIFNTNNSVQLQSFVHPQLNGFKVGRVFVNDPGDLGSIPGRIIPKTLKMVFDTSGLNTQQCKVRIKGKVEQSRKKRSALP